jgi:PEGA domain
MTIRGLRLGRLFPMIGAVTLAAFAGCASSTVLQTQPPGARVSINGMVVGNTPYTLTDMKIVGSTTPIHFDYPGYAPLDVTLSRTEEVDVLPLVAGIFFLVPLLWLMKYQDMHVYQLQPPYAPAYGAPPPGGYPGAPPAYPPQAPPAGPAGYPPPPPGYPPPAGQ